jgi:lipopolysaccharide/colanic/teichoic acid biosynthesis glycosyltransferase
VAKLYAYWITVNYREAYGMYASTLDLAYVENWSLWLDLKILLRTADVVLRGTGC